MHRDLAAGRRWLTTPATYLFGLFILAALAGCSTSTTTIRSRVGQPVVVATEMSSFPATWSSSALDDAPAPVFCGDDATPSTAAPEETRPPSSSLDPALLRPIYAQTGVGDYSDQEGLRFSLAGSYMWGRVGGTLQIPSGGKPGTTTADRPHLGDLHQDTANIGDGELGLQIDQSQEVFAGAQIIHLDATNTLVRPLISHGVHFPTGTTIQSSTQFDWYRFGYRYRFIVHQASNDIPDVTLTPWLEGFVWNFNYELNGGPAGVASRSFTKMGAQIGGELAWRPNGGPITLAAGLASFPQIRNIPNVSQQYLVGRWRFYEGNQLDFTFSLGVEWEQQWFRDHQTISNHVSANLGPMIVTGLQVSF